jgi:TonB-linked SusC/RagA family outer membrane protein
MYLRCTALLLFSMITIAAYAQKTVTGTVTETSGQTLPGVSVAEKGTSNGVSTGADGKFSLNVKPGAVLTFSFIGFKTKEVTVGTEATINVTLESGENALNEVVVTALGIKREKKSLGFAVQEVKGQALADTKEPNIVNSLSGKVAGLQITRSSNGPGGSSRITLRGNNSLTGDNQPLIVVDGVPLDNFIGNDIDGKGKRNNDYYNPSRDMGNGLSDINAEDIESVSVLKGPSAAALYGSRAGNGAILITTKTGKKQNGLGITLTSSFGFESIFARPKAQNQFSQGTNGQYEIINSTSSWGEKIAGQSVKKWDGSTAPLAAYDNIDNYFQTGLTSNQGVSFQQQYNSTSVYTSYNRLDDKSYIPGAKLIRNNLMARTVSKFGSNDRWTIDTKVQYINSTATNRPQAGSNPNNYFTTLVNLPVSVDVRDFKGAKDGSGNMIWYHPGSELNPYWASQYNLNQDVRNRFLLNASVKYQFNSWLSLEGKGGADTYNTDVDNRQYAGAPGSPGGSYGVRSTSFTETNYSGLFTAKKDNLFGKFGGIATLGGNLMNQQRSFLSATAGTLNVPNLFALNNAVGNPALDQGLFKHNIYSVYGTLGLSYDQFLYLDGTFRNDWSSALSKANRSYFYPSVSTSFVFSELLSRGGGLPSWLTYGKVRGSFAAVGNDMDPYNLYNTYTIGKDPLGHTTASRGDVLLDPTVKSELIKSYEAGLEMRLFDSRLGFDFAVYKSNATRQLIELPMDNLSGYTARKINAGDIQNKGLELMVDGKILRSNTGFNWNAMVNFSMNRNLVKSITPDVKIYPLGGYDDIAVVAEENQLYGTIYGSVFARVEDPNSPYNGKLILTAAGLPTVDPDKAKLGSQQATSLLGVTNSFSYKGFNFSFLVDARFGGKIFSGTLAHMEAVGNSNLTVVNGAREDMLVDGVVLNTTTNQYQPNTVKVSPQNYWAATAGRGNLGVTEANLYDASNIRVRNVQLSYDISKSLLSGIGIQRARVGVSANNVWLIKSHMNGLDPESVYATGSNATGFENGSAPTTRTVLLNLTIGF